MMTLVSPPSSPSQSPQGLPPRRSWLARLQDVPIPQIQTPPTRLRPFSRPWQNDLAPKPDEQIADFLLMSILDEKAPPETPGSADLLDAWVKDDLEHADRALTSAGPAETPPVQPSATDSPANLQPAVAPGLSEAERSALLQREIETLLKDAPAPANAQTAPANSPAATPIHEAEAESAASPPAAPAPSLPSPPLSREELDTLLADQAKTIVPEATSIPSADLQIDQKLSEAEGVLAEELTQLIAETSSPVPAQAPPPLSAGPAPAGNPAAEPPSAVAGQSAAVSAAALATPVPVPATPPQSPPASAPPSTAASNPAPAGPLPLSAQDSSAAEDFSVSAAPVIPAAPRRRLIQDLALLLAQIVDLPFGWISELDKNVIGVAAFLLLVGGVVLWALSRVIG